MHVDYLDFTVMAEDRSSALRRILEVLKANPVEFDAVAVRGLSGFVIGGIVAHLRGANLCLARKNELSHSAYLMESPKYVDNYLIVDDFCMSGETLYHIVTAMKAFHPNARCVGFIGYKRRYELFWDEKRVLSSVDCYFRDNKISAKVIAKKYLENKNDWTPQLATYV